MSLWRFGVMMVGVFFYTSVVFAHFGAVIPSKALVNDPKEPFSLHLMFFHPFEGEWMNLDKPAEFKVVHHGQTEDLLSLLKEKPIDKNMTYTMDYSMVKPGDYTFYMIPKPYFEPAENCFIVHYSKVIVNFAGLYEGWDTPLGIKAEIVPMSRPYGIWTGNSFQASVLFEGKVAPHNEVEVEYYNQEKKVSTNVADAFKTQVIKTDANGVLTYTFPKAGWWGFSALTTDKIKKNHQGKDYPIEIGAVLWVYVTDMK